MVASFMAPTLIEQPGARAVLGSGGSKRIRSAVLQVVTNLVALEMPLEEAVAAPRVHVEDGLLSIEGGFSPAEERVLGTSGLRVDHWSDRNFFFGGVHVVRQQRESLSAVGDPRRGGVGLTLSSAPAAS
jgi:gamma-glutamyltranspeptidase/glutathione hydrolase